MHKIFVEKANLENLTQTIENVFLRATKNLNWLKKGDKVLLKPALNSPDPYPATTHPQTIKVIYSILKERGAEVTIADQSGLEHVLHDSTGIIHGSSFDLFKRSGMWFEGSDFISLEDNGWESGFKHFQSEKTESWMNGFYISKIVDEVDHIINLPRISTHLVSGVTLAFKNWVGLLREDSRTIFHNEGPFNIGIKSRIRKSNIRHAKTTSKLFFEKMTEIFSAIEEKLRLTLFTATKAQVSVGPDKNLAFFKAKVVTPEPGLVFASDNILAAEVFAFTFLKHLYIRSSRWNKLKEKFILGLNGVAKEISHEEVWDNPFIKHALDIGLGTKKIAIEYTDVPKNLQNKLESLIFY
jgi:uncharacterized protein (DUF362 family)